MSSINSKKIFIYVKDCNHHNLLNAGFEEKICGPTNKKVKLEWSNSSISHIYPPPYVGCIGGCDAMLNDILGVVRTNNTNTNTSTNTTICINQYDQPYSTTNRPTVLPVLPVNTTNSNRPRPIPRINSNNPGVNIDQTTQWSRGSSSNVGVDILDGNAVVCKCHQPAVQYTSRQQNENAGRKYYKCQTQTCNFFLWGAPLEGSRNPFETPSPSEHSECENTRSIPECNCGWASVQKTVVKEGPNKGRRFYVCSKDRNRCNFFLWSDQETNTGEPFGNNRGRGRGTSRTMTRGNTRTTRKCSLCHTPGHFRNNCPNNT